MNVSRLLLTVPTWAQLLLAILLTAGITVLAVWLLHPRILELSGDRDGADERDREHAQPDDPAARPAPKAPEVGGLAGKVTAIITTAFVFLLAFTLSNFWSNATSARSAVHDEAAALTRSVAAAEALPERFGTPILTELDGYAASIRDTEWPLMQAGDSRAAYNAHNEAATAVAKAMLGAAQAGATEHPSWALLTSATEDMLTDGTDRIDQLPDRAAPGMVAVIIVLGLANLVITAAFQPAPLRPNLFLMGTMATITALLLFVLIQTSNPFVGPGAVEQAPFGL